MPNLFELPIPYAIAFIIMAFILGAVIGSFLNVVILRTPLKQSIVVNRSHCMTCGKQLKNIDLIPIASYIFLRGRCRFCGAKISPRYWIVELLTALSYVLALLVLGLSVELIYALILFPVLIVLSGIDIDTMEIPYFASIIIAALGLISIFTDGAPWYDHLLGAVVVGVPFALLAMFGAMGGGDLQLMAAAGLLLGWRAVPAAGIGIVLGAIGGSVTLLRVPKKEKKEVGERLHKIASEWYAEEIERGAALAEGKSDVLYGSFFKGSSQIDPDCIADKLWLAKPNVAALNARLTDALAGYGQYSLSVVLEGGAVKTASAKKQIVFGPYLAVGVAAAYLFGEEIIAWYLGLL
ncbi:MAG: prepilin peptidase [Bacteroides sp.]|nr:prepilin peptidase [Roseburia sp.]MCM1462926.1 prepilin peptidase [Bacteroides sp.]